MQKAAFQALQLQKDAVHNYIRDQVFDGGVAKRGFWSNLSFKIYLVHKKVEKGCLIGSARKGVTWF